MSLVILCSTQFTFRFCNHNDEEARETGLVNLNCLPGDVWLFVLCDPSSWCRWLVCSV